MTCTLIDRLREPKVLDMAIFDWVASLLFAVIIGVYFFKLRGSLNWTVWIVLWTFFGVLVHWLFGVPTMLGYYLRLNKRPIRTNSCQE